MCVCECVCVCACVCVYCNLRPLTNLTNVIMTSYCVFVTCNVLSLEACQITIMTVKNHVKSVQFKKKCGTPLITKNHFGT